MHVHRGRATHVDTVEDALAPSCPLTPRFISNRVSCGGKTAVWLDGDSRLGHAASDKLASLGTAVLLAGAVGSDDREAVDVVVAGADVQVGLKNGVRAGGLQVGAVVVGPDAHRWE